MKYANVEGERREAEPKLRGKCPACESIMVAKCGERRDWHWAHEAVRNCDSWWERETEWHRGWKNEFPADWQEFVHRGDSGEKHVADVRTAQGWVIEFQHSHLCPQERRAREAFYRRMVWVVDGLRLQRSWRSFARALISGVRVAERPLTFRVWPDECALIQEWVESGVSVFFDFGDADDSEESLRYGVPILWYLNPKSTQRKACVGPIPRANFVKALTSGGPCKGIYLPVETRHVTPVVYRPQPASFYSSREHSSFAEYLARKRRARSRIRF